MANVIYSNAVAKANMNNLLGLERLKRMCVSSPDDALKILQEVNFGENVTSSPYEFEKILYVEEQKLVAFIKNTCPTQSFKNFVLLKNDFHNAEAFIKSKYLKINVDDFLTIDGIIDKNVLKECVLTDNYKKLPKNLQLALSESDNLFVNDNANGQKINTIFKKYLYKELCIESKKNSITKKMFIDKVDYINVSTALRSRNFLVLKEMYIEGGSYSLSDLKKLCDENIDLLKEQVKGYKNSNIITVAIDELLGAKPLSNFEKTCEGITLKNLKKNRFSTDGIFPYIYYCYSKMAEINNVRIIFSSLVNGLLGEEIEGRLRETYEG